VWDTDRIRHRGFELMAEFSAQYLSYILFGLCEQEVGYKYKK
jgi:hypothetical protein